MKYTVQLNLNLIEHACSMGSTPHIFILNACKHACALKIDDAKAIVSSSFVPLVYALDMCTTICR